MAMLGLPPGSDAVVNVGAGSTPSGLDLVVNAVMIGDAPYFVKQGAGIMALTAATRSLAPLCMRAAFWTSTTAVP